MDNVKDPRAYANDQAITLKDASRILCCSYSTALRLAQSGKLKAFQIMSAWRTSEAACRDFMAEAYADQQLQLPLDLDEDAATRKPNPWPHH